MKIVTIDETSLVSTEIDEGVNLVLSRPYSLGLYSLDIYGKNTSTSNIDPVANWGPDGQ